MLLTPKDLKVRKLKTGFQAQRDIETDKIQQLEDTVAILSEQIASLKLELDYKNHKIEEIEQELIDTNHELCVAINHQLIIQATDY